MFRASDHSIGLRLAILLTLVVAYAIATLSPFGWELPDYRANAIEIVPSEGLTSSGIGVARTAGPPAWLQDAIANNSLKLQLEISTGDVTQSGFARILTISDAHSRRNLSVTQDGPDLALLLRTPETNLNGEPALRVEGVFTDTDPVSVEVDIIDGELAVYVDGVRKLTKGLPANPFGNWDAAYRLGFANDFDPQREALLRLCAPCAGFLEPIVAADDRAWRGRITQAQIETSGFSSDYATATDLVLPDTILRFHQDPEFLPFFRQDGADAIKNLLGFVPFGAALAILLPARRSRARNLLVAATAALLASLVIEIAQVLLPTRSPSVTDLLMNVVGAGSGFTLMTLVAMRTYRETG